MQKHFCCSGLQAHTHTHTHNHMHTLHARTSSAAGPCNSKLLLGLAGGTAGQARGWRSRTREGHRRHARTRPTLSSSNGLQVQLLPLHGQVVHRCPFWLCWAQPVPGATGALLPTTKQ